ncbi:MAG: low molecular weight phosphotyrosine protein phosphatase [Flavobacteriales bacterium]|nr:low molecular weight phosphotyrosine protein phosphatase [Flavobacteriales bacterium]MCB9448117.1 low molecular weight phosphotyrosine protein phosphatase [Flavobacteriales bacterium]
MVCLGNICRSPLAEGIMQAKALEYNLNIEVDSAGTSGWHEGEHPDRRATQTASKYGVNISAQRSRPLSTSDFDQFDRIYVMDHQNLADAQAMAQPHHHTKIRLILSTVYPNNTPAVPDPYHGGDEGFDNVFHMLEQACDQIAREISQR